MKVLLVNKFHYLKGGSESYYFELGKKLKEYGHEVAYFSMEDKENVVTGDKEYFVKNVDASKNNIFKALNFVYSFDGKKTMEFVLNDFKPDVIHFNNFNFQLTPSLLLSIKKWRKKNKCKVFYTSHDYQLVCPNHRLFIPNQSQKCTACFGGNFKNCIKNKCIYNSTMKSLLGTFESYYWHKKNIYEQFDKIICPSNFIKNILDKNGFNNITYFLPNFIEINNGFCDGKDSCKERYVLYFGRFSVEKGLDTLLSVCQKTPEINYVFVGAGPLEDKINNLSNVKNLGFRNKSELVSIIKNAEFSICPSEWYEIFGLTIGESIKLGTPVIVSNIGGIKEVVQNDFNGLVFETGNVEDLQLKISTLWKDGNLLNRLTENCFNTSFYSLDRYIAELVELYEGVV